MAAPAPSCAQCGGPGALRCASCRSVHYCGRACQKAAWPGHRFRCKQTIAVMFEGKQLASERGFVREYWAPLLPAGCDVEALLGPPGAPLDAAAAFGRCQTAAMDAVITGYSRLPAGERAALDAGQLLAASATNSFDMAVGCIDRLCPAALGKLLADGVKPGHVDSNGFTLLARAFSFLLSYPYAQSAAALPHALASVRVLLAYAQPSDWLVGPVGEAPLLKMAAAISAPSVVQAVLAVIAESPGGFPAHAVAATRGVLHTALQNSTASFVAALLAAGADPTALHALREGSQPLRPLHALALENPNGNERDFRDKLRLLLDAGADLEATGDRSLTALLEAAMSGRLVALDALLAAGAQVSALRANTGSGAADFFSVLHQLAANNDAALIPRVLSISALDVDVRTGPAHNRCTPLHMAACNDAVLAVSALLAAGASLTATDARGMNALQLAIASSSAKAARLLVEATPRADRLLQQPLAAYSVAKHVRRVAAQPGDAAAAAMLAAARQIVALLA